MEGILAREVVSFPKCQQRGAFDLEPIKYLNFRMSQRKTLKLVLVFGPCEGVALKSLLSKYHRILWSHSLPSYGMALKCISGNLSFFTEGKRKFKKSGEALKKQCEV